jgi:hypothetical protein
VPWMGLLLRDTYVTEYRRLFEHLAVAVLTALSASACAEGPECHPGLPGMDLGAPDQKHIARVHETFCGGTLSSDGWVVGVREWSEDVNREEEVFVTFNAKPRLAWADESHLIIEVTGVNAVNLSKHAAGGVFVRYVLSASLNESSILTQLRNEQQHNLDYFHVFKDGVAIAESLNQNAEQRYETFPTWAKRNAEPLDSGRE